MFNWARSYNAYVVSMVIVHLQKVYVVYMCRGTCTVQQWSRVLSRLCCGCGTLHVWISIAEVTSKIIFFLRLNSHASPMKDEILPGREPLCNLYIAIALKRPDMLHRIYFQCAHTHVHACRHTHDSRVCSHLLTRAYANVRCCDVHNNEKYVETISPLTKVPKRRKRINQMVFRWNYRFDFSI